MRTGAGESAESPESAAGAFFLTGGCFFLTGAGESAADAPGLSADSGDGSFQLGSPGLSAADCAESNGDSAALSADSAESSTRLTGSTVTGPPRSRRSRPSLADAVAPRPASRAAAVPTPAATRQVRVVGMIPPLAGVVPSIRRRNEAPLWQR